MIKVAVCGALGKMGKEVVCAVEAAQDMELVAKLILRQKICIIRLKKPQGLLILTL